MEAVTSAKSCHISWKLSHTHRGVDSKQLQNRKRKRTFITGALSVSFPGTGTFTLSVSGTNFSVWADLKRKSKNVYWIGSMV
jgi:hypothetical protein